MASVAAASIFRDGLMGVRLYYSPDCSAGGYVPVPPLRAYPRADLTQQEKSERGRIVACSLNPKFGFGVSV